MRCASCYGSGKIMGGGMIMKSCDQCNGHGKIEVADDDIDYLLKKGTDHYKQAKDRIKQSDSSLTDEDAEQMLDEELSKQDKPKRGRPKKVDN